MKDANVPFALNPHAAVYREILDQNLAASVRSQPGKQNTYIEIGIRPEMQFDLHMNNWGKLTVGVPVTAGMSPDNYYSLTPGAQSNFFGFVTAGLTASIPLPLPASWGMWDLHGQINWMHDCAPGTRKVNSGHADFYYGGAGIALHY